MSVANALPTCTPKFACFPPGTPVATTNGPVPIERVRVGTEVWSWNAATGAWRPATVHRTFAEVVDDEIVTLSIGGSTLEVTAGHPFLVLEGEELPSRSISGRDLDPPTEPPANGHWVSAGDLRMGDVLLTREDGPTAITGVATRTTETTVHNLHVEETHTYAVGENGVLAHNASKKKKCDDFDVTKPKPKLLTPAEFEQKWRSKVGGGDEVPFATMDLPSGTMLVTGGNSPNSVLVDVPTSTHLWKLKRHESDNGEQLRHHGRWTRPRHP